MYKELTVKTNSKDLKVFMQNGFYSYVAPAAGLHAHSFAELHFVMCDNSVMSIGDENVTLNSGDMLVIPGGIYHRCISDDEYSMHTAFQIDCDIGKYAVYNIGASLMCEFFSEIHNLEITGDYSKFSAYVALFSSYFEGSELHAHDVTNYKFLIREFLSQQYNRDVKLSGLAGVLRVSERQAERLVIENMGVPFREALVRTRLEMAQNLMRTTNMTLNQIASYVGYKSYSGFWKAIKKYNVSILNDGK